MPKRARKTGLNLSLNLGANGSIETAYLRFADSKVARTEEVEEDAVLVDYDARGRVIGIEVIGPVNFAELTRLAGEAHRPVLRRLVRETVPQLLAG